MKWSSEMLQYFFHSSFYAALFFPNEQLALCQHRLVVSVFIKEKWSSCKWRMKKLNEISDSKNMANIEACYFIKHKHLISEELALK